MPPTNLLHVSAAAYCLITQHDNCFDRTSTVFAFCHPMSQHLFKNQTRMTPVSAGAASFGCLIRQHGNSPTGTSPVSALVPVPPHPLHGQSQHGRSCPNNANPGKLLLLPQTPSASTNPCPPLPPPPALPKPTWQELPQQCKPW